MHGNTAPSGPANGEIESPRLLSLGDAALALGGITVKELRRRIVAGDLEDVYIGRRRMVVAESLDAYVERLRRQAADRRAAASVA